MKLGSDSIGERLQRWAIQRPAHTAVVEIGIRGEELRRTTFEQLFRSALRVASELLSLGAGGERVLLQCHHGAEFIAGFFGCLYAGAFAVPAPVQGRGAGRGRRRAVGIVADAKPVAIVVSRSTQGSIADLAPTLPRVVADLDHHSPTAVWASPMTGSAFIQYTSGSTLHPKGVIVSHESLAANLQMISTSMMTGAETVALSWLPLFHDMGLVGGPLHSVFIGATLILMRPDVFFRRPELWLKAITRYRATLSGGPNFAFAHCINALPRLAQGDLDLTSWKTAFCGSEKVRPTTMQGFASAFAAFGFRPEALYPCYGMAEVTLFASGRAGVRVLQRANSEVVSCGPAPDGSTMAIVDPQSGRMLKDGETGEIWISGPHVASGYYNLPTETARTFRAETEPPEAHPFVRTGDVGFLVDGELYVTGRLKDVVVMRGENIHPEDIEATVSGYIRCMRCAAFGIETSSEEQLVVVIEDSESGLQRQTWDKTAHLIKTRVAEVHGIPLHDVLLVPENQIPITTSGKVRRRECRNLYDSGELGYICGLRSGRQVTARTSRPE